MKVMYLNKETGRYTGKKPNPDEHSKYKMIFPHRKNGFYIEVWECTDGRLVAIAFTPFSYMSNGIHNAKLEAAEKERGIKLHHVRYLEIPEAQFDDIANRWSVSFDEV